MQLAIFTLAVSATPLVAADVHQQTGATYTLVYNNETGSCVKSGMMPKNNTGSVKTNSSLTFAGCEQVSGSARPAHQTRISFKVLVDVTHAHGMRHNNQCPLSFES